MAHKKAGGSSRNGRDSAGQRLGVKLFGGQQCTAGSIIVCQRGTKFHPGTNVGVGKDHTLFAKIDGKVRFEDHGQHGRKISVSRSQRPAARILASLFDAYLENGEARHSLSA